MDTDLFSMSLLEQGYMSLYTAEIKQYMLASTVHFGKYYTFSPITKTANKYIINSV